MDRKPGLSVRLKLTLSYAGFLMLAGVLLLAAAWLSEHGAEYGLCQIYRNEPWHYELRTDAADRGCPRPYADPTHDPRMQK